MYFFPLSRAHGLLPESKSADMLLWLHSLCNAENVKEVKWVNAKLGNLEV